MRRTLLLVCVLGVFASSCVCRKPRYASSSNSALYSYIEHVRPMQGVIDNLRSYSYNECRGNVCPSVFKSQDGQALSSWRFQSSLRVESLYFYDRDAAWDDPKNWDWANAHAYTYQFAKKGGLNTDIVAITGKGTAFDGPRKLSALPADAILLVETQKSNYHWMEPGDFDIDTMPQTINAPDGTGISGHLNGAFCVAFADGDVWVMRADTPFDRLKLFFRIYDAQKHDRNVELGNFKLMALSDVVAN